MTGARIEVDLNAFRHNVATLSSLVAPSRTMLAVKANAYGHGLVPLAFAALESGADSLAVLEIPAALELRRAGITAPLFAWLHGPNADFTAAVAEGIDLGVSAEWQVRAIAAAAHDRPGRIHLKIDTGLHRNGANPEDWPALVDAALDAERSGRVEIAAIWSHLADASPEDDAVALALFEESVAVAADRGCTPPLLHLAASSAGIRMPQARLGLVRFGIAAYGISPFDDATARDLGLRPVMSVRAPVLSVVDGRATIGIGSADGVPAPAVGRASGWIAGARHPLVDVGIDSLALDVSGARVAVGDEVILFGAGDDGEPTAEEWADWAGTIGDEIVARASERVPRVYLG
ncbi:alanine racemase [Schumannella luteola]